MVVPKRVSTVLDLRSDSYYIRYGIKLGRAARRIEMMIRAKIDQEQDISKRIDTLHKDLKALVGETLTKTDTIKTLAQHMVLYRVFNMLFPNGFNNPISRAMESAISGLNPDAELEDFKEFYAAVEYDIRLIKTPKMRQELIKKIYESFLRGADKKSADKHGVVYTPIEMVDFIIHSIDYVLNTEFDTSFADASIKVLDPFTGAGTFIARLLESGMIPHDKLYENYKRNIHANELMLLAYYVASVNIETTYQSLIHDHRYVRFDGMSLTDTFDQDPRHCVSEKHCKASRKFGETLKEQERVKSQKLEHLHIIMGNPPYSSGQKSANEDNENTRHPRLEKSIKNTYMNKARTIGYTSSISSLNNSYIKAFRWASDRIGKSGIIGFVTPSSFVMSDSQAGLRACFEEEFTDIWCFNLRGDGKIKENWKKEGAKIFRSCSREPIGIIILVKNPAKQKCTIHYKAVDDYVNTVRKKLEIVRSVGSVAAISDYKLKTPNKYHDWINQRGEEDEEFKKYMPMGIRKRDKKKKITKKNQSIFTTFSNGVRTGRDAWVYNASEKKLEANMKKTIAYCSAQDPDKFQIDPKQAAWSKDLSSALKKLQPEKPKFIKSNIRKALYRPFIKQYLYLDGNVFVAKAFSLPSFFPPVNTKNPTIVVPGKINGEFSVFITDMMPDADVVLHGRCFPLRVKNNVDRVIKGHRPARTPLQISSYYNPAIIIPNQTRGEFSVFITDVIPDAHTVPYTQCFPMKVME